MSTLTIEHLLDVQDIDIKKLLSLSVEIDSVEVEITFDYVPSVPSTTTDPSWEAEVEVTNVCVYIMFADVTPIRVSDAQSDLIKSRLDSEVIELACWEHIDKLVVGGIQ